MNGVSLLGEIIAQGGKVTSGFYHCDAFDGLIRHGFLREAGIATSMVCADGDVPYAVPGVFEEEAYGYISLNVVLLLSTSQRS